MGCEASSEVYAGSSFGKSNNTLCPTPLYEDREKKYEEPGRNIGEIDFTVFCLINQIRKDPRSFVRILELLPEDAYGPGEVREAISFLKK